MPDTPTLETFSDVIDLWPTPAALHRRLPEGYNLAAVRSWRHRGSIPEPAWDDVINAAHRCGFTHVSYPMLAAMARRAKGETNGA